MVVGLLGNKSPGSNRFTLVTPKSENDVRLQATLGNQTPRACLWEQSGLLAFPCDWSCIGSLVVLAIGTNRGHPLKQILWSLIWVSFYALVYCLSMSWVYGLIQFGVALAIPVLALYNGRKSSYQLVNTMMKWFFYAYYPLHLLIIGLIGVFCL